MNATASIDERSFRRILSRNVALPIGIGVLGAALFIALIGYLLYVLSWVEHTDMVMGKANEGFRYTLERESSLRGYLIAGDDEFLDPFEEATPRLESRMEELAELVGDNPVQLEKVRRIEAMQELGRLRPGDDRAPPCQPGRHHRHPREAWQAVGGRHPPDLRRFHCHRAATAPRAQRAGEQHRHLHRRRLPAVQLGLQRLAGVHRTARAAGPFPYLWRHAGTPARRQPETAAAGLAARRAVAPGRSHHRPAVVLQHRAGGAGFPRPVPGHGGRGALRTPGERRAAPRGGLRLLRGAGPRAGLRRWRGMVGQVAVERRSGCWRAWRQATSRSTPGWAATTRSR